MTYGDDQSGHRLTLDNREFCDIMDVQEEAMSTESATMSITKPRRRGKSPCGILPRKQFPLYPTAQEIGAGVRAALIEAGYVNDETGEANLTLAAQVITRTLPAGQVFTRIDMCALCQGYKDPQAGRLMSIIGILGLRMATVFPHLYDPSGQQYTPSNHPWMFPDRYRIDSA